MEIFKLFGSIFVDNAEANKNIEDTEKKAGGVASKFGEGVKTAAKWGAAIVGGATAAAGAVFAAANKTAEYADEIDKLSERTGINREELQRWKYAAEQSGGDIGKLEVGVKKLSDIMDSAIAGNEKAAEAFAELGISVDDLQNKSQEFIFERVMNGLADMEQGARRNALGNDLLGKSYTELLPLLNAGSDEIRELKYRADELGLVMSEDAVKANVKFGDTLQDVKSSFGALTREFTNGMLPMLQNFLDFTLKNLPVIQEMFGGVMGSIGDAVAAILPFLMDLIQNALPPMIDLFSQISTNILPPVITLFTEILQAVLPPLIELISGITSTLLPPLMEIANIFIEQILPPIIDLFNEITAAVLPPLMDLFKTIIDIIMPPLIEMFQMYIDQILPVLIELWNEIAVKYLPPIIELITEIVETVLPPLLALFGELAKVVLPLVMEVFEALMPVIEPIMNAISSLIKAVLAIIKGDWEGAWNYIKEFFTNIWDAITKAAEGFGKVFEKIFNSIKEVVLGVWNGIVDGIKKAINWVIGGINLFIRGLNKIKIPDWVPLVGGKGIDIKEIPLLAAGGEITQRGHAIVGEAGPELLELPQGAKVKPLVGESIDYERLEAITYTSIFDAFVDALKVVGPGEIVINLDGSTLARRLIPRFNAEYQRMGVATT